MVGRHIAATGVVALGMGDVVHEWSGQDLLSCLRATVAQRRGPHLPPTARSLRHARESLGEASVPEHPHRRAGDGHRPRVTGCGLRQHLGWVWRLHRRRRPPDRQVPRLGAGRRGARVREFSITNSGAETATAKCFIRVQDDFGDFGFDGLVGEEVGPGQTITGRIPISVGTGSFLINHGEVTDC